MFRWRPKSLRAKLLLFSVLSSLLLGIALGLAWLYFEVDQITAEINLDNRNRLVEIQSILADEFREKHGAPQAHAQHIGRAFFTGPDMIKAEITTPDGMVLAARDQKAIGRISGDSGEIRKSVRLGRSIVDYWALRRAGDLAGKAKISGLNPFDSRPKVQEFTAPVVIKGRAPVVLHIYISLQRFASSLRQLIFVAVSIVFIITTGSAAATFFWLDRLIYKPILALDETAERITAGDTGLRAGVTGDDEFGALAQRFNTMADSLISARFQADTDSLTGLFNYRHLHDYLGAQVALGRRYRRELTVAMLDIDHFKNVNDLYGHPTGDDVLRMAVAFIKSQLRQVDYVARYGGEEFVVIMPETGSEEGLRVMKRIIAGFPESVYVERMGVRNPVFTSVGVADFPSCGEDADSLLGAADMALLLAKRRGRNQVSYFRSMDQKSAG